MVTSSSNPSRPPGALQVPHRGQLRCHPGPHRLRQAPEAGHPVQSRLAPRPV